MATNPSHYVDNSKFYEALVQHKKAVEESIQNGNPKPRVSEYIGECILLIANGIASRPNFMNYHYRDDMIGDGIENALQAVDSFDPEKSKNPFGYFTRVIWFAFLRRIEKEKTQMYIKVAAVEAMDNKGSWEQWARNSGEERSLGEYMGLTSHDIEKYSSKKKTRKTRETKEEEDNEMLKYFGDDSEDK